MESRRRLTERGHAALSSLPGAAVPGWIRLGGLAGVVGPVAFTLAWIIASLRQAGEPVTAVQISGLAADDASDPWLMISGFLLLGGCAVAFGAAVRWALGGWHKAGLGPLFIQVAGILTIAAGLLRRDHTLLTGGPQSWHNHAHDVISAAAYVSLIAAPILLARRLRQDSGWRSPALALAVAAGASAIGLVVFYAAPHEAWDGLLQRISVSLPLAAIALTAATLIRATR
jgi:hypothetical protein